MKMWIKVIAMDGKGAKKEGALCGGDNKPLYFGSLEECGNEWEKQRKTLDIDKKFVNVRGLPQIVPEDYNNDEYINNLGLEKIKKVVEKAKKKSKKGE